MSTQTKPQFLKLADLVREYQLPKSTVYLLMAKQGFPKQIKISKRATVWRREAVDKWFADKEAESAGVSS